MRICHWWSLCETRQKTPEISHRTADIDAARLFCFSVLARFSASVEIKDKTSATSPMSIDKTEYSVWVDPLGQVSTKLTHRCAETDQPGSGKLTDADGILVALIVEAVATSVTLFPQSAISIKCDRLSRICHWHTARPFHRDCTWTIGSRTQSRIKMKTNQVTTW